MPEIPARKRRRLSPPESTAHPEAHSSDSETQPIPQDNFSASALQWSLEQNYERHPRKQKHKKEFLRLPIKTAEGRLEHAPEVSEPERADSESLGRSRSDDIETPSIEGSSQGPISESSKLSQREQVVQAKEELAKLGSLIIENPEENIALLRTLAQITSSTTAAVMKLGLATQLAVYKDIIPGYRIRPQTEDESRAKLSKEVRTLRNFEHAIVEGYRKFVKELARIAGLRRDGSSQESARLITVAVSCASNLVVDVPHFNYRTELLRILVDRLSSKQLDHNFTISHDAVKKLFEKDDEGNASLEAVAMLAKMIKARDYRIDERVLNLFLNLRLLSEFSKKGSSTTIDKSEDEEVTLGKMSKDKRVFRTKKQRKLVKERRGIEKEMREADAVVSHEQRDQLQAETLKLVFGVYIRLLKARIPNLMGPVLEGLVKYGHLINQDFFGDLLESLKELIQDTEDQTIEDAEAEDSIAGHRDWNTVLRNVSRESLLCVITAFALLQGQDAAAAASSLKLDLSFFISHLYRTLYSVALDPDVESSSKPGLTAGQSALTNGSSSTPRTKVDVQRTVVLLLRSLQAVLLPSNSRAVSPVRLAAFVKQILTSSLHVPEKSCTALVGLIVQIMKVHGRKIAALWQTEERRGDGVFDPLKWDVEGSNPFAATVWEGELLRLHYAPGVREGIRTLELAHAES